MTVWKTLKCKLRANAGPITWRLGMQSKWKLHDRRHAVACATNHNLPHASHENMGFLKILFVPLQIRIQPCREVAQCGSWKEKEEREWMCEGHVGSISGMRALDRSPKVVWSKKRFKILKRLKIYFETGWWKSIWEKLLGDKFEQCHLTKASGVAFAENDWSKIQWFCIPVL